MNEPESAQIETTRVDGSMTVKFSSPENNVFTVFSIDFFIAHPTKVHETHELKSGSPAILTERTCEEVQSH